MPAWYDLGTETANAVVLGSTWGVGPVRSAAEVQAFAKALGGAVAPNDACLLAAWLGGASEDGSRNAVTAFLAERFGASQAKAGSAAHACSLAPDAGNVAAAMTRLHKASPLLATVVYMKATAKAALRADQAKASAPGKVGEHVREIWKGTRALYNDKSAIEKKVVSEALSLAGAQFAHVVSTGAEAVRAAVEAAALPDLAGTVARALPWWAWVGIGVAVVGGVAFVTAPLWKPALAVRKAVGALT